MNGYRTACTATALFAGFALTAPTVAADPVAEFYKDRTVTFLVGAGAGGTYGLYAQVLIAHIAQYLPGRPTIVTKYQSGGGGVLSSNYLHNAAPKDGSVVGMTQQTIPVSQVLRPGSGRFDVREWQWIGNMAAVRNMLGVWHTAPAQTIEEAKKIEVMVGATGKSSPTYITPAMLNRFVGTKFRPILGYSGVQGLDLAMERGETFGRGASWDSIKIGKPDWVREKKFKVLVFDSVSKAPDLPDVPRMIDLVQDPSQRRIAELVGISAEFGRAFFFPPGVPAERVAAWRKAFDATMKDKAFLADAEKRKVDIEPMTAAELDAMVKRIFDTPADVIEAARKVMEAL